MSGVSLRTFLTVTIVALASAGGGPALSEETASGDEQASEEQRLEAKEHFEAGSKLFSAGEFEKAIPEFQKAYGIVHSPEILYNIARCHEELGREQDAIYNYEVYLKLYPTAGDADDVRHRITVLKDLKAKEDEVVTAEEPVQKDKKEFENEPVSVEDEPDYQPEENWYTGLRMAAELGVNAPIPLYKETWKRVIVPAYLSFHLPLADWAQVSVTGILGVGASKEDQSDRDEVKGIVGIFAGFRFVASLSDRFELFGRAGGVFIGLAREHHNRMTLYLAGEIAPGFTMVLTEDWRLVFEAVTNVGVIFPGLMNDIDAWGDDGTILTLTTGGMVGMEFEF
jgi:hypothetical protein